MGCQWKSPARAVVFAATLMVGYGCSDSSTSQVKGNITYNGKPIETGRIEFFPLEGNKGQPAGGEIKEGAYTVRLSPGDWEVQIKMPGKERKRKLYPTPDSPYAIAHDEGLPAKYNMKSQLKLQVGPGVVEKDWPLTSK